MRLQTSSVYGTYTIGDLQFAGESDYSDVAYTDQSGDADLWLLPADGSNGSYTITATPPSNVSLTAKSLQNVVITADTSDIIVLNPLNQPPSINAIPDSTSNEGDTYTATGSFTDSDSTSWTGTVNYGDGSSQENLVINSNKTFSLSHVYKDNGVYTVTVTITDKQGATSNPVTTQVTVANVAPTVGTVSVSESPIPVGTALTTSANFTDPGVLDTHTASIDWGDATTPTVGSVTETNGSGQITGSHTYTTPGVYIVKITLTDKDGGVGTNSYQYVAVYDSSGGFLTGSGIIQSPSGADTQSPHLTGDALSV